jgi:hypothetical protein
VFRFELNRLELKGCRLLERYRLSLFGLTAQTTLLGLLMFFMYYILGVLLLNELGRLASFPRILIVRTRPTYQRRKRKVCPITTLLLTSCTIM